MISSASVLQELAKAVQAKKAFGQNFLVRADVLDKIVAAAHLTPATTVIEIGPGPGSLTRWLLQSVAAAVVAIEKDPRMVEFLTPLTEDGALKSRFALHQGDALHMDFWTLGQAPRVVVANLPYNVATPLLCRMLDNIQHLERCVLMFQHEVALRLLAKPNTRDYGRLAVLTQLLCLVEPVVTVPPSAFQPAPKVMSMVVALTPRPQPLFPVDLPLLQQVLHHVFQQRRKMLRAGLRGLVADPLAVVEKAHIDPTRRAETLSLQEFCTLTTVIKEGARGHL